MECHVTGETPSKAYPRKNFVSFFTPLGVLRFRDEATLRAWVEKLPPESRAFISGHDVSKTPGVIVMSKPEPGTTIITTPTTEDEQP